MFKYIMLALCVPLLLPAQQPVKPIISQDYISLINSDSLPAKTLPNAGSNKKNLQLKQAYTASYPVKTVKLRNGQLTIIPARKKYLSIGGNYTIAVALATANRTPLLQNQYVQGESINGALAWQGPETNEMFSYGPAAKTMQFDGSQYPYDVNGRLVKSGTGNGTSAIAYNNSVLKTGYLLTHSFSLSGNIRHEYSTPDWAFALKASTTNQSTIIQNNSNADNSFSASLERNINHLSIKGAYTYFSSHFSNDNSNGFLNRVYQNALLTPASFANAQGGILPNGSQKSYSQYADNPLFLLNNNGHYLNRTQQTANLSLQKKYGYFNYGVISSLDALTEKSNNSIKAGTAFFPTGLPFSREQNSRHYTVDGYTSYTIRYNGYEYSSVARINFVYNNEDVNIAYPSATSSYHYQRKSNDIAASYNTTYNSRQTSAGLNVGNKFYNSNTSTQSKFFLPDVSGFIRFADLFYLFDAKLTSTYHSFYSETAINSSYAPYLLTQLTPQNAFMFMPVNEVQDFNNLQPIQHNEFTSKIELQYNYRVTLSADMFIRNTNNDVYPTYNNGQLLLKNMVSSRTNGLELQLDIKIPYSRTFSMSNSISFYKYNSMVTHVADGYSNTPIAGFANVYKAVIEGKPLGSIVGSSYVKDATNKTVIGNDGFPIMNNQPSVIGNPIPDFTLKFSHALTWKKFALNIDWEYKKGGDVWNGTQAVLDYYGRSATTAVERNITNYVFNGVLQNGHANTIPVNFYNVDQPVNQNKWARYGYTGIAEAYIQKGDAIRIHNLAITYTINYRKYLQRIRFMAYMENLKIWSAYKGADANQLLYGQANASGLDFFNLPSTKNMGINVSVQF